MGVQRVRTVCHGQFDEDVDASQPLNVFGVLDRYQLDGDAGCSECSRELLALRVWDQPVLHAVNEQERRRGGVRHPYV